MRPYGVITSPNYPQPYPKDQHCAWTIVAPRGHKITLIFKEFVLEHNTKCSDGDFLTVYDGENLTARKVGEFCGRAIPPPFTSSTDKLYIKFRTNRMTELKGFSASYNSSMGKGGPCMFNRLACLITLKALKRSSSFGSMTGVRVPAHMWVRMYLPSLETLPHFRPEKPIFYTLFQKEIDTLFQTRIT